MSHLNHPNTVKVYLYGELDDGSLYIVMEHLEGKNLNQVVRKEGPLPPERAIPVLIQVCGALQEAHLQGIVHRDLKPENIFLSTNGGLKDFPKVLAPQPYRVTIHGIDGRRATVRYYSPDTDSVLPATIIATSPESITLRLAITEIPNLIEIDAPQNHGDV